MNFPENIYMKDNFSVARTVKELTELDETDKPIEIAVYKLVKMVQVEKKLVIKDK